MGKYDVSLEDLGLDDLVAAHPVTVATTLEPPEQPPVMDRPSGRLVVGPATMQYSDPYAGLRSYVAWLGPVGKWGHYLSAGAILVSLVQDSAVLLAFGLGGLMLSIIAFAMASLLRISLASIDSLSVIENKFRS